jgi:hypothetical protein
MKVNWNIPSAFYGCNRSDVIDVSVRYPDCVELMAHSLDLGNDSVTIASGIDDCSRSSGRISHDVAVLLKRADFEPSDDQAE